MKELEDYLDKIKIASTKTGFSISYKGKILEMPSGKRLWRTKGHAQLALNLHCRYIIQELANEKYGYTDWVKRGEYEKFLWREVLNLVEFIELK